MFTFIKRQPRTKKITVHRWHIKAGSHNSLALNPIALAMREAGLKDALVVPHKGVAYANGKTWWVPTDALAKLWDYNEGQSMEPFQVTLEQVR